MSHTVLVIDDDASTCELLAEQLDPSKFAVFWTTQPEQAEGMLRERAFDAVLTDVRMRRLDGIELCERLVEKHPGLPVVIMTAYGSMEVAVRAMRAGASDLLTKPIDLELFAMTLERAISHASLRREVVALRREQRALTQYGELVGSSHAMQSVYQMVERAAPSDASVLISGESGTGKEVLARTITAKSARANGPFVAINCAALPEPLLESELFGHTKGAFTDARAARDGLLLQANHGTLFLDEVGDLPLALQPKLLRVLQERVVRPVGSDKELPVDVRLICATHRDLEGAIAERRFRADLYYRINVIHIGLPRLALRGDDVLLLARHFLARFGRDKSAEGLGLSADAERLMSAYPWPGNVRELANCMERAVVLARGRSIDVEDLPEKIREFRQGPMQAAGVETSELVALEEIERRYILRVLDAMHGNKSRAAQVLGLDRKTLYRRLERYGAVGNGQAPSVAAIHAEAPAEIRH
jgi:two-component system response regulator HydG